VTVDSYTNILAYYSSEETVRVIVRGDFSPVGGKKVYGGKNM